MAFENVTLFEVNLPSEILGRGRSDEPEVAHVEGVDEESEEACGGSSAKLVLAAVALAGIGIAVRRLRSGDEEAEIEMAYEEPGVDVEQREA